MKSFNSAIKKANIPGKILGILGLLFVALLFAFAEKDGFEYLLAKESVFMQDPNLLEGDKFYDVTNDTLYDCYAEDDEGEYYVTYSFTDEGNFVYMGYYVYNEDLEKASAVINNTWNVLNEEEDDCSLIEGKGYIYDMGIDECGYFDAYMEYYGASEQDYVHRTIVLVPKGQVLDYDFYIKLVLIGVVLIIALIKLIQLFAGSYKKNYRECLTKYNLSDEQVDADFQYATCYGKNFIFGRKYFGTPEGMGIVIPYDKMEKVYPVEHRRRRMLYGIIPIGTTKSYSVNIETSDGTTYFVGVKKQEQAEKAITYFQKYTSEQY